MHSLQFQPDQAAISPNKERSHMYTCIPLHWREKRETEKLQLPENQNSFLPSAAYHPTTERDLKRTCAKVSLSDLQEGTGWFKHTKHLLWGTFFFSIITRIIISIFHIQKHHTEKKHSCLDGLHTNPAKHFVFGYWLHTKKKENSATKGKKNSQISQRECTTRQTDIQTDSLGIGFCSTKAFETNETWTNKSPPPPRPSPSLRN